MRIREAWQGAVLVLGLSLLAPQAASQGCLPPNPGNDGGSDASPGDSGSATTGASDASSGATRRGAAASRPTRGRARTGSGVPAAATGARVTRGGSGRAVTGGVGAATSVAPTSDWDRWWQRNQHDFVWSGSIVAPSASTSATGALTGRGFHPRDPAARPARSEIYTRIVPDLLAIVDDSDDEQLLAAAALALGRTVEPPFETPVLEALVGLLPHRDGGVRVAAALGIGLLGSPEGTDTLLHLSTCSTAGHRLVGSDAVSQQVRAAATLALGYANDADAVPRLIDICERMPDAQRETKTCAFLALGLTDNRAAGRAAEYLASRLGDRRLDPAILSAVPIALARVGQPGAVPALLEVLADRDTDTWVAQSAVIGLGRCASLGDEGVVDVLAEVVEEERDAPTRQFALIALGRLGARDAEPSAHTLAHDRVTRLLARQLHRPRRSQDRPWAAIAAGLYGRGQPARAYAFTDRMLAAYEDVKDPARRGAFALGLGLLRHEAAAEELLEDFLDERDEALRGHLAMALGLMGHAPGGDSFRAQLTERGTSVELRRSLGTALRLLGDRHAARVVGEVFREAGSLARRAGLATALGQLRERHSAGLLVDSAVDPDLDPASRAWACSALGLVAEKTTVPWSARLSVDSNTAVALATLDRLLAAY